jgi:transcriptional regulator with XRE-family HTH domain
MYECKIAEKLAELRSIKGVTQDEVANALSISNKTVSKWENGASAPDLPMLVMLAEYYEVTTDALLGLSEPKKKTYRETIRSEFDGLDSESAFLKAFETTDIMIPSIFYSLKKENAPDENSIKPQNTYPESKQRRSKIATPDFFTFTVSSEDVNAAVTLLRNKSDFAWLKESEKQKKITRLFRLLANEEALLIIHFTHSVSCSVKFTADYVSDHTGIKEETVSEILSECCKLGICTSMTAHLTEKDVTLYECYGDGLLLTILSLACEKTCGKDIYNFCYYGYPKMIGGQ